MTETTPIADALEAEATEPTVDETPEADETVESDADALDAQAPQE